MRKSFLQAVKEGNGERPLDLPHPNGMSFGALQPKRNQSITILLSSHLEHSTDRRSL